MTNRRLLLTPLLCAAALLAGCASVPSGRSNALVGLWTEESSGYCSVTFRGSDGVLMEKTSQVYKPGRPPAEYESMGHWRLSGSQYIAKFDSISLPSYKNLVGREVKNRVISIAGGTFQRRSSGGGVIEERRIGDANYGQYQKTPLPMARGE